MSNLVLSVPMAGWLTPLDEAPDAVFAERMLGDGLAVDPTGSTLHAPCAATVIAVHRASHAITLRAANGAELLMHIGLDTVALDGAGFEVHVRDGQPVETGDLLISFDIDLLARQARSLLTPVVVTNPEAFAIVRRDQDQEAAVGDFLMELRPLAQTTAAAAPTVRAERRLVVPMLHGVHARPAGRIAQLAKTFAAETAILAFDRRANARSPIALMSLGIRHGDEIIVEAAGDDAEAAVQAIADLIAEGMGEAAPLAPTAVDLPPEEPPVVSGQPTLLQGVRAAPGLAIGQALRLTTSEIAVAETGADPAAERRALDGAVATVKARLEAAATSGPAERRGVLAAHLAFLDDPELLAAAHALVNAGKSAGFAWRRSLAHYVDALRRLGDSRLAERIDDLMDLERQVLLVLSGDEDQAAPVLPQGVILLADELLPSQLMALDAGRLRGLCTTRGGPTSHVAILAAAMNLPLVVAAGPGVMRIADGAGLILDADAGTLRVAPDAAALEAAQQQLATRSQRRQAAQAAAHRDCVSADGVRIEVMANLASVADAATAAQQGAEGCGLVRTEFLFLDRATPPSEDEQAAQYQAMADALSGKPLVIRTLDVGGDKAAPYLPIPPEDNPAMGLRGVRISLWRPHLLRAQLRAILRVAPVGQCRIMVPMVTGLDELRAVRAVLDDARAELGVTAPVELGVMIETPAAAATADLLAAEADFFSIGSNDLTQYVLAMDRGNPELAGRLDGLHPAVLRMIAGTVEGGVGHGRQTSVCGGLAADLAAVPILLGLGVTRLSAPPSAVPEIKALVRTLSLDACR
ncbi:MAG: phosphoenolpyruvate-protein phosphotransferase, partial [Caulobacter sp.]|nr:phosphoenolpyruvate-protein phosphotransferase [Caulobacter sp.]